MKKITILLIVGAICIMFACKKSYLDKVPLAQLSESSFWKSQSDADLALAGCYNFFSLGSNATSTVNVVGGFGGAYMHWDGLTDNAYTNSSINNFGTVALGFIEPIANSIQSSAYTTCYQAIAQCNLFLSRINDIALSDSIRNKYIGEIKFIRAYHYFLLTELYGDAVLTLSPLSFDSISIKQPRVARKIVTDSILVDLDFAIRYLPNTLYSTSGHAVKGTALAYKAKVLLTNHLYAQAADVAQQIMSDNVFSLTSNANYANMFLKAGQASSPEIMMSSQYLPPNFYSPQDWLYSYDNIIAIQPLSNLVKDYECTDGLPITSSPLYNSATPYVNRDPRLAYTIIVPGAWRGTTASTAFNPIASNIASGFLPRKGIDQSRYPTTYSSQSDQAWVLMRYAEVLLMYAEAQNEAVGPNSTVYAAINAVRTRVNMPAIPAGLSQDAMRTRIRHEYRVEFGMEGHRFFDLKRWKLESTMIPTVTTTPTSTVFRTFYAQDTLWPIPLAEINTAIAAGNKGIYQTPGF